MNNKIVLYATILNGMDKSEKELQYRLILLMIKSIELEQDIDEDEFFLMVEEAAGQRPVSANYAKRLLLETGCFIFDGEYWFFNEELSFDGNRIPWQQFLDLFDEREKISPSDLKVSFSMDDTKTAVIKGIKWCVDMVQLACQSHMKGLPAFLKCGDSGDSLIGKNAAGTATSDALSMLCCGEVYIKECGIEPEILSSSFTFLIVNILGCQCMDEGWDRGGFFPLEDQPEAGHPTVDATCLALEALGRFYENRKALENNLGIRVEIEDQAVRNSLTAGLEFLLRMQWPKGCYGIYKYKQEYPDSEHIDHDSRTGIAMPNDNCTRMVLLSTGICLESGLFDEQEDIRLFRKCIGSINRAYDYLKRHKVRWQGIDLWMPYFGRTTEHYPLEDIIVSTARVCKSLVIIWQEYKKERKEIEKICKDFFGFWKQNYAGDKTGKYIFRVPGKDRYSDGTYEWRSYPDMIAAFTVLQGYNTFGISLNKDDWEFLENAVVDVLKIQHPHGHWNSPLDEKKTFCAATLSAIELLSEYRTAKGLG